MRSKVSLIALGGLLVSAPEAEACSWVPELPTVVPFPGGVAPNDAPVLLRGHPGTRIYNAELWEETPGVGLTTRLEADVVLLGLPGLEQLGLLTPRVTLREDQSVAVVVPPDFTRDEPTVVGRFGGGGPPSAALEAPTDLRWYDERLEATINDSCIGQFREVVWIEVRPVRDPDLRWLRVTVRGEGAQAQDFALIPTDEGTTGGHFFLPHALDAQCVDVRAVAVDGTQSAPVTRCAPNRCTMSPGGIESWPFVPADWSTVEDGCNVVCTPNASTGHRCQAGEWSEAGRLALDEGGCHCSAASASPVGETAALLLLFAVGVARRRLRGASPSLCDDV